MRRTLALTVALLTLFAGCASTAPKADDAAAPPSAEETFLDEHGLAGQDTEQIVDELDRLDLDERPSDLMASVRVDELVLSDEDDEVVLDLPEDRFYLSVAPYVETTHECFYHSLTTCKGELGGEEVQVTVTDDAGEILVDEEATVFDNGFVGLWLPRDVAGTLAVEYDGKSAATDFGTSEDDPTCLTTLQLT